MKLQTSLFKLRDSISIYSYNQRDNISFEKDKKTGKINLEKGQLYLISNRSWAQKNSSIIRDFYIKYYSSSSTKSAFNSLKSAFKIFNEDRIELLGLVIDSTSIYAISQGGAELWLIRNNQVVKLISGLEASNNMSGWLKENDILVGLVGVFSTQGVAKRLTNVAQQLQKSPDTNIALLNIFKSAGISYPGAIINFQSEITLSVRPTTAKMIKEKAIPPSQLSSKPKTSMIQQIGKLGEQMQMNFKNLFGRLSTGMLNTTNLLFARLPTEEVLYAVEQRALTNKIQSRNRKILLGVALILLIGLSSSIAWGVKQRRQAEWQTKFGTLIEDFKVKMEESKNIAELNPNRARDLINQAGGLVELLKERGLAEEQLANMQNELGLVLGLASGKKKAENKIWLNLNLVRAGMQAEDMMVYEQDLVILDQQEDRAIKIGIDDKSAKVLAGQAQLGQTKEIAIYGDQVLVFSDLGISSITNTNQELISKPDPQWGQVFDMQTFAGNIYLANETGIWKYPVIESGFGAMQPWLAEDPPDLASSTAMTIDGFIWIAKPDRILKFVGGVPDSFQISNLEVGFSNIKAIYADEDSHYLYVLEPDKKRIVLLDKQTGEYKEQYSADEFADATDLVVKETEKFMLILAKDKILEMRLD